MTTAGGDDVKAIGHRVRTMRTQQGASLSDLATRAGVSKSYLSTVELGTGTRPGAAVLHKIASALGVTLADLLGRTIQSTDPLEIPQSLHEFARRHKLPQTDIDMLAGIKFRGEAPRTVERWQFIYNAIVMSATSENPA